MSTNCTMLSALKEEILAKKRQLAEKNLITNDRKYFKRSELDKVAIEVPAKEATVVKNHVVVKDIGISEVDDGPALPRTEAIRRLRDRREPILLYGETVLESFKRLRQLEILEPEMNRGFRNDFQEALEKVDQAYLNEILMTSKIIENSKDVATTEETVTIESVLDLAKDLPQNGNVEMNCKVVSQFVLLILQLWGSHLNGRTQAEKMSVKGKMEAATYSQTCGYLKPLTKRLKKKTLPDDILESLAEIICYCLDRHYVKANDAYLQMAIGNAPWPIGVTMVGIHARTGREKIYSKHVAHVLNDETQRKYIQGLKRLITKCQFYFPTSPSRSVEYQAPSHA